MISGNINRLENVEASLSEELKYCIEYAKTHDLINYPTGWYDTEWENISFRIDEYATQIPKERFWESHKRHTDLYILLRGTERIDVCDIEYMQPYRYIGKTDLVMYEEQNPATQHRLISPGDFLICFTNEAHKTGVNVELRSLFKIVLFKIRKDEWEEE